MFERDVLIVKKKALAALNTPNVQSPMHDERDKLHPETPFINKDYKSFDLDLKSYFV